MSGLDQYDNVFFVDNSSVSKLLKNTKSLDVRSILVLPKGTFYSETQLKVLTFMKNRRVKPVAFMGCYQSFVYNQKI